MALHAPGIPTRVLELPEASLPRALNLGLAEAKTELVARMDADDRSAPQRLERQVGAMSERPELIALGCAYSVESESGRQLGVVRPPVDAGEARWRLLLGNALAHGSMLLRRERVRESGGYDESKVRAQDYDLWLRLSQQDACVGAIPDTLYALRRNGEADAFASTPEQGEHASASLLEAWARLDPGPDQRVRPALARVLTRTNPDAARCEIEAALCERPTREALQAWLLCAHTSPPMPGAAHEMCRRARLREVGDELRALGVGSITLWGAGGHSAWVLAHETDLGVEVNGIVDDTPGLGVRYGFEVAPPDALRPGQSVLLSSDWHEDEMWASSAPARDRGVHTLGAWRATVIDDGSHDDGASVVRAVMSTDPRVRLVRQENRGLSGARNRGLDETRADAAPAVLFLDADDWMTPTGLEQLCAADARCACGGFELTDAAGALIGRECHPPVGGVGLDELLSHNPFAAHAVLTARDAIGRRRFDESLPMCEDYDFWLRLGERGVRWERVASVVARYRIRPTGLSKKSKAMAQTFSRVLSDAYERAAVRGWGDRGVDLSPRRLAEACGGLALHFATVEALKGAPAGEAIGVLRAGGGVAPRDEDALALAAITALQLGLGIAPEIDGRHELAWSGRLWAWWAALAEELEIRPEVIQRAAPRLAARSIHPALIASGIARACPPGRGVGVLGTTDRARWVAGAALQRGLKVRLLGEHARPEAGETLVLVDSAQPSSMPEGVTMIIDWDAVRDGIASERAELLLAAEHVRDAA
eukprot:g5447.t1